MRLKELARSLKAEDPALADLTADQIAAVLRGGFARVAAEIGAIESGVARVPSLGRFQVKEATRERDGETRRVRRVRFQPAARGDDQNES